MDKSNLTIHLFASFGHFSHLPAGGGQTSARRLLNTIKALGYNVTPFGRHVAIARNPILRKIEVYTFAVIDSFRFAFHLLFKKRRDAIVLFIGYSGAMLPLEVIISLTSRLLGFKVVYFLKGGGARQLFEKGTSVYRWLFRQLMGFSHEVFVEGQENEILIKTISSTKTFYLPNYVEKGFAPLSLPEKPKDRINFIYFGRIDKNKNIHLIIDIFENLCKRYHHLFLTIIGSGAPNYEREVNERIKNSSFSSKIRRMNMISHFQLKSLLPEQHILLFPSIEPREGHSNTLNEAMAWGIVPVVSSNNFLPQIVEDDSLVASGCELTAFNDILTRLINDRTLLEKKSNYVHQRVTAHFIQPVVESRLDTELENIIANKNAIN